MSWERIQQLVNLHNALFLQDLKARYQDTLLGFVWPLVYPVLFAGVLVFLFQYVLELNVRRFSSFVLIGVLGYTWFRTAISQATRCITANRNLARRPGFMTEVLPVIAVTISLFDFLLAIPILVLVVALGGSQLSYALFSIPLLILIQFVLTLGIAFLLATVNLVFRDTAHLVDIVLMLGFFLTPIFYDIEQVPERLRLVYYLNPLVPLLRGYREAISGGSWPHEWAMAILALLGIALTIAGWRIFNKYVNRYIEEV
jgi:lipopolysaccharide transport system permease protein